MKLTNSILCTCLLSVMACANAEVHKNVLMIAVDDLNDWTGAFGGHPQASTPNIDKLAAKGIAFQSAYSASPVCNPSRTALLTGRRPHETGIDANSGGSFRESKEKWIKELTTLPQYFTSQGYTTATIGKIFHKPSESKGEFELYTPDSKGNSTGKSVKIKDSKIVWSEGKQPKEATSDWKNADYGVSFLKQQHEKPFFLAVGIFRPHLPWHAPKAFYDASPAINDIILPPYKADDLEDVSGSSNKVLDQVLKQGGMPLWKEAVRAYLANSSFADNAVGHLLDGLANSPYAKNTIVVLWGDHGWHLGEKKHFQKFTVWERASKTSFVIYDPIDGKAGNINHAVSLQDIYPTLIDLTGIKKPEFIVRGRSLKPLIENPTTAWAGAALVGYNGSSTIFSDRYHYIENKKGGYELYDLETDPNEWTNVVDDPAYQEIRKKMKAGMDAMQKDHIENPFEGVSF